MEPFLSLKKGKGQGETSGEERWVRFICQHRDLLPGEIETSATRVAHEFSAGLAVQPFANPTLVELRPRRKLGAGRWACLAKRAIEPELISEMDQGRDGSS